jgi:eukaryotic-like serine/threonine-protein kinase
VDVQTARTMLRQQLAGPLASTSPPHMATDPYSVVPAQRPPAQPVETQPLPPQPNGQIGGRAMLAPGESLTDHLAKLQQSNAPAGGGGRRRAPQPDDTQMPGAPTGLMPAAQPADRTNVLPPREAWDGARAAREPLGGTVVSSPAAKRAAMMNKATGTVKEAAGKAVATVRGWPRQKQLIAGGGALAVVVVLVLLISLTGGGGKAPATSVAQQTGSQQTAPSFPTQAYNDRGITVQVPKGWTRKAAGSWVDYIDPDDAKHKVRILVEDGSGAPTSFLTIAEKNLKKNATSCPKPYARVGLNKATISGKDGAVLEYTCGSGDDSRHGLWGAVVTGGHAFSFYVTSSEAQFADSKPIFDEMIKTYTLTSA